MPTHYEGSAAEKLALDVFIKLARATDSIAARTLAPVLESGLTTGQFGVLETLLHLGPQTLGTLAEKHLRSPNNLTVVVDNLERDGLVRRERDTQDRRVVWVHLTDAGCECITSVFPTHVKAVLEAMSVLSNDEQQTLQDLLRKLGRAAQE